MGEKVDEKVKCSRVGASSGEGSGELGGGENWGQLQAFAPR